MDQLDPSLKNMQNHNPPFSPDQHQVERQPPSLQITSTFLVFYGLSHDITLEKKCVAQNLIYSKIWWTISWNCWVENLFLKKNPLQDYLSSLNAVISTNKSTEFITVHVIYNPENHRHVPWATPESSQSPFPRKQRLF